MKKLLISIFLILTIVITILIIKNVIPPKRYDNSYFNIEPYTSDIDMDNDGVDDQTDILNNAFSYIESKPRYESKYYANGYPDDGAGVCTDVVGYAMLNAGYDLRNLVNTHILNNRDLYDIEIPDKNIDFRRVRNLVVYFKYNSIELTIDYKDINNWQGGDIVIFKDHIGIVSSNRNSKGIPLVIHHMGPFQVNYEEDILGSYEIVGHYRVS